jgi:hypothetical protein
MRVVPNFQTDGDSEARRVIRFVCLICERLFVTLCTCNTQFKFGLHLQNLEIGETKIRV